MVRVLDVISVGLQNLTSGEKNLVSNYNAALKQLQTHRQMTPVSVTMLQEYSEGPTACPPTPPAQLPLTPFDTVPILPAEVNQDLLGDLTTALETRQVERATAVKPLKLRDTVVNHSCLELGRGKVS